MIDKTVHSIKSALQSEFENYWKQTIDTEYSRNSKVGKNKLRTYREFKIGFSRESYLTLGNNSLRQALSRFRLSAHKLKIETGRYNSKNNYVQPHDRHCLCYDLKQCEDEKHFLINCPAYSNLRHQLFTTVITLNANFTHYNDDQKFIWLMSTENIPTIKLVAKFIIDALTIRKSLGGD
jgi:hypothetical protein